MATPRFAIRQNTTRKSILQENQSYIFRSYFEMPYQPDEILAELGYSLIRKHLTLPRSDRYLQRLEELKQRIGKRV